MSKSSTSSAPRLFKIADATKKPDAAKKANGVRSRFATLNSFCDVGMARAKLTPLAVVIWLEIYRHGEANQTCRVSADTMATKTGYSRQKIFRGLAELKTTGMARILDRGDSRRRSNLYEFSPTPVESWRKGATSPPAGPVRRATSPPAGVQLVQDRPKTSPDAVTPPGVSNNTPQVGADPRTAPAREDQKASGVPAVREATGPPPARTAAEVHAYLTSLQERHRVPRNCLPNGGLTNATSV